MRGKNNFLMSEMYCTRCGRQGLHVARQNGKYREAGHLKKLYCIYCQTETNHVEIKPSGSYTYEDFKLEYDNHNFDKDGNRITKYSMFRQALIKEGII